MRNRKLGFNRRQFLKTSAATGVLAGTSGLYAPAVHAATEPLKIGSWGGFFEEVLSEKLYPEFTAATGIEVDSIGTPNGDAQVVQLAQAIRAGNIPLDVSALIPIPMVRATNAGIIEELDMSRIPNAKYLPEVQGLSQSTDGNPNGVAWFFYFNILVTLRDDFPQAPNSWTELWNPSNSGLAGVMAQPEISNIIDITAATYFGGPDILKTKEGTLEVLQKVGELKETVSLWYRDEAQFQNGLETGELPIGIYYNDVATVAQAEGIEIDRVFPKEGAVKNPAYWGISKGTALRDQAHEFLNFTLDPSVQALLARNLGGGPVVPRETTDLTDEEWGQVSTDASTIAPAYHLYTDWGDWTATEFSRVIS
ncbi:PotD/PotF family extracellular solute-binding protein [uncultured Ruegeria sp.]|uniref:ABC transporter substrate-binding protein n=1 Tax=uncultured Ruegeria sp. TaxID=259304 RepID=UPI00261E3FF7|nr:substrate-binding domain-containing protein [uncultured Ruegeria sp.]